MRDFIVYTKPQFYLTGTNLIQLNINIGKVVEIGYNKIMHPRRRGIIFPTVIYRDVRIGNGCVINIGCTIGRETMIGHHCVIREATEIGDNCKIGHLTTIEGATKIGHHTSIFANCHVSSFGHIGNYVFMGPMVVSTNDPKMSYIRKNIEPKEFVGPTIHDGARIGGGCTILPGITIGREAMIGAGAIITRDIPDYAIAFGAPAKVVGTVPENELLKNNGINI